MLLRIDPPSSGSSEIALHRVRVRVGVLGFGVGLARVLGDVASYTVKVRLGARVRERVRVRVRAGVRARAIGLPPPSEI